MKPENSDPSSASAAKFAHPADDAPRSRPLKKLTIGLLLAVLVYLLSYGPAVTSALNRYGRLKPRTKAVLCTIYTPAQWLADNSDIYGDYRLFWVKKSRNYQWWLHQHADEKSHQLLPPASPQSRTAPGAR